MPGGAVLNLGVGGVRAMYGAVRGIAKLAE